MRIWPIQNGASFSQARFCYCKFGDMPSVLAKTLCRQSPRRRGEGFEKFAVTRPATLTKTLKEVYRMPHVLARTSKKAG